MTFLAPIPAIIAASLAVPALLTFYFLKLRRRPVRVSSTLLWMQATSDLQVNVPLRMIRASWLLVLQLLILASLLVALRGPAVHLDTAPAGRAVILIDRSASMAARDGVGGARGESRLDEAKRRALVVLDQLGRSGGTQVMVVAYAAEARTLTGFTSDRAAVREAIRAIEPADQPDNLAGAIGLVSAATMGDRSDATDESAAPERMLVVLVGDGGTPVPAGLMIDNADWRFEGVGPAQNAAPDVNNLGIAALSARRDYQDPATVRVFARVVNAGSEPVSAAMTLTVDGQVVERRPIEVPMSSGPAPTQTGEATVTFEFLNADGGTAVVAIGRADSLGADDAAGVVLSKPDRPGVLLVNPEGSSNAGGEEGWLIGDVLAEMGLSPFITVAASEYERLAGAGGLGRFSLIVFDRVRPVHLPPVASMSFGAGLPAAGAPAPPGGEPGAATPDDVVAGGTRFLSWDRAHPVLRDVSLDSVVIGRSIDVLRAIDLGAGGQPARVLTELARGGTGPLIELVEDGPVRRLVVGFELSQSNWPVTVGFPILVSNAVDYLTLRGEAEAGRAFTTVEPARVRIGPDAPAEITLHGPVEAVARPAREPGAAAVSVGVLERAGVYTVGNPGQGGDPAVAVNMVSQTESALRTSRELMIAGRTVASAGGGGAPREVWPWFVLAAAGLLAAEWFLHAFMMKV